MPTADQERNARNARFTPTPEMPDLWHYLRAARDAGRPIVLYGMGNGADKILEVCTRYGIEVQDFFASDGFVRGHSFHGKVVLTFDEVCARYGADRLIVLLAFATARPEVLALIDRVAATCELYVPDVPVCGDRLFDAVFYHMHREQIDRARALFSDETSRRVYDGILSYKLSGRLDVLAETAPPAEAAYTDILPADRFETMVDLGAYTGDSIRALRPYAPRLTRVVAMEPDRRNFRKLSAYAEAVASEDAPRPLTIYPVNEGAWETAGTLVFDASGNRNATLVPRGEAVLHELHGATGRQTEVIVNTPDRVVAEAIGDTPVDFIKYDVEGAEHQAIMGSRALIERDHPALLVSAYHRSEDIFALPLLLHFLSPDYRLYLRRAPGVPAWDINLYALCDNGSDR